MDNHPAIAGTSAEGGKRIAESNMISHEAVEVANVAVAVVHVEQIVPMGRVAHEEQTLLMERSAHEEHAVSVAVAHEACVAVAHESIVEAIMEASVDGNIDRINIAQGGSKNTECGGVDEKMHMKIEGEKSGGTIHEDAQAPSVFDTPPGIKPLNDLLRRNSAETVHAHEEEGIGSA